MSWTWKDLTLFTGAVYGIAWLLSKSKLTRPLRGAVVGMPLLGELLSCIVCTGTWVSFALMTLLPWTDLFSADFRVKGLADFVVLTGWVLASNWTLGRLLGDASTEAVGDLP